MVVWLLCCITKLKLKNLPVPFSFRGNFSLSGHNFLLFSFLHANSVIAGFCTVNDESLAWLKFGKNV